MPDAITLLKEDHRKLEGLFKDFKKATGDGQKKKLAEQICAEVIVHSQIEEEIFYPACEGKVEEADIKEAFVEHDAAKVLVAEIASGGPDDEYYESKVKVLQEELEHHIKEEEGWLHGIFSQAKRHGVDMDALGDELDQRRSELMAKIDKDGLPKVKLATMDDVKV